MISAFNNQDVDQHALLRVCQRAPFAVGVAALALFAVLGSLFFAGCGTTNAQPMVGMDAGSTSDAPTASDSTSDDVVAPVAADSGDARGAHRSGQRTGSCGGSRLLFLWNGGDCRAQASQGKPGAAELRQRKCSDTGFCIAVWRTVAAAFATACLSPCAPRSDVFDFSLWNAGRQRNAMAGNVSLATGIDDHFGRVILSGFRRSLSQPAIPAADSLPPRSTLWIKRL